MIKRILLLHFCFMMFFTANAGTIEKGYHGFADVGYSCYCTSYLDATIIDLTTSHGYQFSPYLFLGAGVGFDYTGDVKYGDISGHPYLKRDATVDVPIFFNGRLNFTKTKIVPFLDLKAGTYINNEGGVYLNAMVGCRYSLSNNRGISLSLGFKTRKITAQRLEIEGANKYNQYKTTYYYADKENEPLESIVFKVGFDF